MPKGDIEVLKADIEDGYGKVANLLMEALIMARMNGVQKSICLFIIRRTYFWGVSYDRISLNDFAQSCDSSRSYVSTQLKLLIEKNIILRKNYQPGKTPLYGINTRVAQWDKGFVDAKQLHEYTTKGLYKCETLLFRDCERVHTDQTIEKTTGTGVPKDMFKDSITITTVSIEDGKSAEGKKDNHAVDVKPDFIKLEDVSEDIPGVVSDGAVHAVNLVESHYAARVLGRAVVGTKDMQLILEICRKYPADFIIKSMDETCEEYRKRNNGVLNIKSFKYFVDILEDEWQKYQVRKQAEHITVEEPVIDLNKRSVQKQSTRPYPAKANRFHNFEQRTARYSKEELEALLKRRGSG